MRIEDRMEHALNAARQIMEDSGNLEPFVLGFDREGHGHALPCPWADDGEKDQRLAMVRLFFLWRGITEYVSVAEAWMVERPGDDPGDTSDIAQAEDRQDVVAITGISASERRGWFCPVVRDGAVVGVGEPVRDLQGPVGGRMAELLPRPGEVLTDRQRSLAELMFQQVAT